MRPRRRPYDGHARKVRDANALRRLAEAYDLKRDGQPPSLAQISARSEGGE